MNDQWVQCESRVWDAKHHVRQCYRGANDHFRGHDYCWQHYKIEIANRQDWDVPL